MSTSHWHELYSAWARLRKPLQLNDQVIAAIKQEIAGCSGPILLLGITQGLTDAGHDITALERDETSVRNRWRASGPNRRAVVGDWQQPPFAPGTFAACIGDGIPIALRHPEGASSFYDALAFVLAPGGKFVTRIFAMPDARETVAAVKAAAFQGENPALHGLQVPAGDGGLRRSRQPEHRRAGHP